jgi:hypothetical protein
LPFDRNVTIAQLDLRSKMMLKKRRDRCLVYVGISLLLILIVIPSLRAGDAVGPYVLTMAVVSCYISVYWLHFYYFRRLKGLKKMYRRDLDVREKNKDIAIIEFTDTLFRYKMIYYDISINWEGFFSFQIVNDSLFLNLSESVDRTYVFSSGELGAEQFQQVLLFVRRKIPRQIYLK